MHQSKLKSERKNLVLAIYQKEAPKGMFPNLSSGHAMVTNTVSNSHMSTASFMHYGFHKGGTKIQKVNSTACASNRKKNISPESFLHNPSTLGLMCAHVWSNSLFFISSYILVLRSYFSKHACWTWPFIKKATQKGQSKEHCIMSIKEKQNISSQSF